MNFIKFFCTTLIFLFALGTHSGFTKDRNYKFSVNGHSSDEISNQDDFAMKKAAEYALKKGYSHFIIEDTRRYTRKAKNSGTLGSRKSTTPRPRTELKIHVYDANSNIEDSFDAAEIIREMNSKYSE